MMYEHAARKVALKIHKEKQVKKKSLDEQQEIFEEVKALDPEIGFDKRVIQVVKGMKQEQIMARHCRWTTGSWPPTPPQIVSRC